MSMASLTRNMTPSLAPILLLVSTLFLFTPASIYESNSTEFGISLLVLMKLHLLPAVLILLILAFIGVLLPRRFSTLYASLMLALGVMLWVQGNILLWRYGSLDGQDFDWTTGAWRGWVDSALWLSVLLLACVFRNRIRKATLPISLFLICLQLSTHIVTGVHRPDVWKRMDDSLTAAAPPRELFEFSTEHNVIHFVLDYFQSTVFQDIIDQDSDRYTSALEGFTFFKEATGSFPTTYMSVPAFLSGKVYGNDTPMPAFVKDTLSGLTLPNALWERGYEVDLVTGKNYWHGHRTHAYTLAVPYVGTQEEYEHAQALLMMDLSLFRCAPHFLKQAIYNDQFWFLQRLLGTEENPPLSPFSSKMFLDDMITKMSLTRDKPVYKYIHLYTPHAPFVLSEDGELIDDSGAVRQATYALKQFIQFIDELKSLGIYDRSLILLHADHGSRMDPRRGDIHDKVTSHPITGLMMGEALPLLAIKPPQATGAMTTSVAPVELTDIPATVNSLLSMDQKFPGRSAFRIAPDEVRERRYASYTWQHNFWGRDYMPSIDQYIITGRASDPASWRWATSTWPRGVSYKRHMITFGTEDVQNFLDDGWSENDSDEIGFNWALGESASMNVSISASRPVLLRAYIQSHPFPKPQTMSILVNDKTVGMWELGCDEWQQYSTFIEPDEQRPDPCVLKFVFSQHAESAPTKEAPGSARFAWLSLDEGK